MYGNARSSCRSQPGRCHLGVCSFPRLQQGTGSSADMRVPPASLGHWMCRYEQRLDCHCTVLAHLQRGGVDRAGSGLQCAIPALGRMRLRYKTSLGYKTKKQKLVMAGSMTGTNSVCCSPENQRSVCKPHAGCLELQRQEI